MTGLTFALCTDLHFGPPALHKGKLRKLSAEAPRLLSEVVDRIAREVQPQLVINLGDDIEDESPELDLERYRACAEILSRAGEDRVHVAGNHDTVHLSEPALLEVWRRSSSVAPAPGSPLHYAFDRGGVHFVVLHSHEEKDRSITLGETQLAWLAEDLRATSLPTIVLMHHAAADQHLVGNRWFEGRPHIALVRERKELRGLLGGRLPSGGRKVLAVFNGHLHWNHLDVIEGIPYVTLQSLIENLDDDAPGRAAAAFAVVRVTHSRLVVEVSGVEPARYQFDV